MLIHETAALMRRRFEQAARPEGLTLMQWRTLGFLSRNGPQKQVALVEALEASPMTVSDLAERMETAGLVTRLPDPSDGRAKVLALTGAGEAKVAAMKAIADEVFADALGGVSDETLAALTRGLGRIKDNLGGKPSGQTKDVDQ